MSGAAAVSSPAHVPAEESLTETFRVEIFENLAAAEPLWRSVEGQAIASPYQRFDWVAAFASAGAPDADIRVVAVLDPAGTLLMLLPLAIERRAGLGIAAGIGGKHTNFNLPLLLPAGAARLGGAQVLAALRSAAARIGVDVFAFASVPRIWGEQPNPLAAFGAASPSDAYEVRLERDPDATSQRSMTNEARKRLRNKERGLAKLGEVALLEASSEAEVDMLLEAFLVQKEERFRELGIADPFIEPGIQAFIRSGATGGLADGRPAIELYGLLVGGRVAAVLGGAADANRLSGMFISFAACKETTKYSPGDILVSRVVREQCLRGRSFFDLGVGEARYKRTFCNDTVELVDVFLPVSLRGRGYALARRGAAGLKRRIKQNPHAMRLVSKLRRATAPA